MKPQTRNILISVLIVGAVIGVGVWASRPVKITSKTATIYADDNVAGSRAAKAVLVEYSDFQCPACGAFEPIVEQVRQTYGERIALVYRHYPLSQHQFAPITAQAAEAAALQGKFWEYHDLLFSRQKSWSGSIDIKTVLVGYAQELGLDTTKFTVDLESSAVKAEVAQDRTRGDALRLPGTPSFYLNGQSFNPRSYNDFTKAIDQALAS